MSDGRTAVPVAAIEALLTDFSEFAIARNEDLIANLERGGDIDLLVADPVAAERTLLRHLGAPLVIQRRSYVVGYYYPWGYIDLFPSMEWRGAVYLPVDRILRSAVVSRLGAPKARPAHEALICWFSSLLWGGFFKDRYRELITRAALEDAEEFRQVCAYAAGNRWSERLVEMARTSHPERAIAHVRMLRRAIWWRAFWRSPAATTRRYLAFWRHEIRLRIRPPLPWVALLGSDGSGKSSVIDAIDRRFRPPVCAGALVCHWRPGTVFRPPTTSGPELDPHGKPRRSVVESLLKLAMLFMDWHVGYWGRLVHRRAKGALLVSDRYFDDIIADPVRYRFGAPAWAARVVARLLPKPDIVILLDAPVDVLRSRKQEVPADALEAIRQRYRRLVAGIPESHVVDSAQNLEDVTDTIESIILKWMTRRAERSTHERVQLPRDGEKIGGTRPSIASPHA